MSSAASASAAIATIDSAINTVNSQRATIGAAVNRMTYAADNMTNISANASASRSTIMDTDYATASTNLSKAQIIQQASTAMLAQANQQPQTVLGALEVIRSSSTVLALFWRVKRPVCRTGLFFLVRLCQRAKGAANLFLARKPFA